MGGGIQNDVSIPKASRALGGSFGCYVGKAARSSGDASLAEIGELYWAGYGGDYLHAPRG